MHRKPRTVNFTTLSDESKKYIRDHHNSIGKKQMMGILKVSHKTISAFMKEEGLEGRYAKKANCKLKAKNPKKVKKAKSEFFRFEDYGALLV
mgnify:FL=1